MNSILKRALAEARYLPQMIRLVWEGTAFWTACWLALLIVQGALPAVSVFLTRSIVDGLLQALRGGRGWSALVPLAGPGSLLGGAMLLQLVANAASGWVRVLQVELLRDHISRKIHEKSVAVRLQFYDFPEYYDRLHRAREEAMQRPAALLEVTGGLLRNTVTLIGVGAVLLPYGLWLPAVLLLSSLPSLALVLQSSLRRRDWYRQATPQIRRARYFDYMLTSRESAAEVRVFELGAGFVEAYQHLRARLLQDQLILVRRETGRDLAAAFLGLAVAGGAGGWALWQALEGRATAGTLAMFFAAFTQGQTLMRSVLQNAGQIYTNGLFLGNLFEFLALDTEPAPVPSSTAASFVPQTGIRFSAVDFCYPGASRPALAGFSLEVPAGQTAAIVGQNGAGKSTIIKLLCRFYEPDRGSISIGDVDITDRAPFEIRRLISVLFQEPVHYAATVAGNVAPAQDADGDQSVDRAAIVRAVRAAGAEAIVARLPKGYDSLLGRWFQDGLELSGGEWQRVALARAFLRDAPILLLDEPTSAMDSWAEADWFARFREAAAGRTAVIITHRFTTAMQADVIHVMEEGRIVESGSHEHLVAQGGRYAQSWARQTREPLPITVTR